MKQTIFFLILGLLIFASYGSFNLSRVDYKKKNICPKIVGIPACYLVFLFFALTLVAHLIPNSLAINWWYFGFLAIPFLLALSGTVTELSGKVVCPRTAGGTPMCYISLAMCSALLIMKIVEHKLV